MEINFKKVHTAKDLIISSSVLIAGIGLFFVNKGLGILFAACGVGMFFICKSGYRKDGRGVTLRKVSKDLSRTCRQSVLDYLDGKDICPSIIEGNDGGSIRIDVFFNESAGVAYAQVFNFDNYAYEPATTLVELHSPKADKLISQIV